MIDMAPSPSTTHHRNRLGRVSAAVLALTILAIASAQQPPGPMSKPMTGEPSDGFPALELPAGGILIIPEADPLGGPGERVSLTVEQYNELRRLAEQARGKLNPTKPRVPSRCTLHAHIGTKSEAHPGVSIRATFEDEATEADEVFLLGCRNAKAFAATLQFETEGRFEGDTLPILKPDTDGLIVLIDRPGRFRLIIDLELDVIARGSSGTEIGYELHLPGSPITVLTQDPIPEVTTLKVATRTDRVGDPGAVDPPPSPVVDQMEADRLKPEGDVAGKSLGPASYLTVTWDRPASGAPPAPLRTAQTDIEVRVTDTEIVTRARIHLHGSAKEWRIWAPRHAELTVEPARASAGFPSGVVPMPEPSPELPFVLPPTILRPAANNPPEWRVQFPDPAPTDVLVTIHTRDPRPGDPDGEMATHQVGPFRVRDTFPDQGTIRLLSPSHWRLIPRHPNEVRRVDPPTDLESGWQGIAFRYGSHPIGEGDQPVPLMELDVLPVAGRVVSHLAHRLRQLEGGWEVVTEIQVTPVRTEVDRLDFYIASELQNLKADSTDPELVEEVITHPAEEGRRRVEVRLSRACREPFSVELRWFFPQALTARETELSLPRLLGIDVGEAEVRIDLLPGFELHGEVREWENDRVGVWTYPLVSEPVGAPTDGLGEQYQVNLEGAPALVSMTWDRTRPDLATDSEIDLTLSDRQALVVHRLQVRSPVDATQPEPPHHLRLSGPITLEGVRLMSPGVLTAAGPGEWVVSLPAGPVTGIDLHYAFPLPPIREESISVTVPLIQATAATRGETRLRIWRGSGTGRPLLARSAAAGWQEQPTEVVPSTEVLPALVLVGGFDQPLTLELTPTSRDLLPQLWVDRSLIEVIVSETGVQQYRARFRIRRWLGGDVEVEVPAPPALKNPEFYLDGQRVTDWEMLPAGQRSTDSTTQRVVRVGVPNSGTARSIVLDVRYQLDPTAAQGMWERWTRWEVPFLPPRLRGGAFTGPTRWLVALPPNQAVLSLQTTIGLEQRLTWRNGRFRVQASENLANLERWFNEGIEPPFSSDLLGWNTTPWVNGSPALSGRQTEITPFEVIVIPSLAWILGCSVLTLLLGLVIWRFPRWLFWTSVVVLSIAGGAITLTWPQVVVQLFAGAQFGLVTLLVVLFLRWSFQVRYRRRITHMTGFTRRPTDSALVAELAPREGTTVDASPAPDPWAEPASSVPSHRP